MTGKTKNILLVIGSIITLVLCYNLAFSKTLQLKSSFDELIKEDNLYKNAPKTLSILRQKEHHYDSILERYKLSGGSIQNTLLKDINTFSEDNSLKVNNFLEPHVVASEDLILKFYQFSLEGDYNAIIKLIYTLEQESKFGEIINVHFEKKKNFRTGLNYIQAQIILKNVG